MSTIPTLFVPAAYGGQWRYSPTLRPGLEWVAKHGMAQRRYDGISMRYTGGCWMQWQAWPGGYGPAPSGWLVERDAPRGEKAYGWAPIQPGTTVARWVVEAVGDARLARIGTYELCGPGIHFNPEGFARPRLIYHGDAEVLDGVPTDLEALGRWFARRWGTCSGVIWKHRGNLRQFAKVNPADIPPALVRA